MTLADDPNLGLRRIIIASPPASGSAYIAGVMARYFDASVSISPYLLEGDHNFTHFLANELRGHAFCFDFHMMPHVMNMLLAREERVLVLAVWRNIADLLLAIDDLAMCQADNGPAFHTSDVGYYRTLEEEQRQLVRLDMMLAWYLRFYLSWRATNLALHPYEQMLAEQKPYFERILEPLAGHVDDAKLDDSLAAAEAPPANAGGELRDTVKRELEQRILRHPDAAQLEVLLWELPWSVPALEMQHELDGQVVMDAGAREPYFVSRGRRYPISRPTWLESRTGARRAPKLVDAGELEGLPAGAPLL